MNHDIWFTYKSRIAAEVRLKNNDLHSQILLVWYAIVSSAAAVVALRYEKFAGPNTDIYTTILSIALLGISLLVASRDYRGRALQMRANHISLKRLYEELNSGTIPADKKPELYSKLLLECENHTPYDYRHFRIFNSSILSSHKPTKIDYFLFFSLCIARMGGFLLLYLLPFAAFWRKLV
ncbi:SLATT domain-containing protein [Variovorax boronicumulans]|uniref:SLATT domain-containing protein n=1 Tax=Variovorax boronicumulans TaxID=436515 RepID=UPI0009EEF160|nr:SLATT domain-containing protein [Variovorax boronicumulans]